MAKPVPVKLPPGFNWVEGPEGAGDAAVSLLLHGESVLRIVSRRAGWLVVVDAVDPALPQADVAVHSVAAGMRWSARWANGRAKRLYAMVEGPKSAVIGAIVMLVTGAGI